MAPLERRFWPKVDKHPGQIRVGMNEQAHRVAWELTFGSPPAGLL